VTPASAAAATLATVLAAAAAGAGGAPISGEVRDADGLPVSNALVVLQCDDEERPAEEVRTDRLGAFELPPAAADGCRVLAWKAAGTLPRGQTLGAAAAAVRGAGPVRLALPGGAPVDGRVVDPAGRPIPGVLLVSAPPDQAVAPLRSFARGDAPAPEAGRLSAATSDGDGRFRLPRVAPGSVLIFRWPEGIDLLPAPVPLPAEGPVIVTLPEPLRVRGSLASSTGRPLEGASLTLGRDHARGAARFDLRLAPPPASGGWLRIGAYRHAERWVRVVPRAGGVDLGRIVLRAGDDGRRRVRLRVRDAESGAAIASPEFGVDPVAGPDRDGAWSFDVEEGPVGIDVWAPGLALQGARAEPGARTLTVALAPAGNLEIAADGVAGRLVLHGPPPIGRDRLDRGDRDASLRSLPEGRYVVSVEPERFTLFGSDPEPAPAVLPRAVEVFPRSTARVSLAPAGEGAELRVRWPGRECLRLVPGDVDVASVEEARALIGYTPAWQKADAVFLRLPPSRYTLVGLSRRAGGLLVATRRIDLGVTDVRAPLAFDGGARLLPCPDCVIPGSELAPGEGDCEAP
jgi:hypothetical protein